ncbi:MAG: S8 family serine peptidase [Deltaproteobacteria bacterium]|nr:S8 family serine peptidase [Deltaproteobacteria bacterium]
MRRVSAIVTLAALAALAAVGRDARADAPARPLVRHLVSPSRARSSALVDPEGRVPMLVRVPAADDPRAHGLLPVAPGLGAIHLAPGDVEAFAAAHPALTLTTAPPRRTQLDYSGNNWTNASSFRKAAGVDGTGVVVGILDTGVDVSHADFRDANGKSRIAWLLRREPPLGRHPELEARFGCTDPAQSPCAIYSSVELDELIAAGSPPGDTSGHGTHVAAIAAGNGGLSVTKKPRYVGVAPGATLVVAAPSSEGFSDPDILNAARFIFDRADALGLPAVINASLGSEFGPHDGTSELERGLAAMIGEDAPGRAVVVAAGNDGQLYESARGDGPYGIHTEVRVSRHGVTRVPIVSPGASGTIVGAGFVWLTFDPEDEVDVALEGPLGASIGFVGPGDDRGHRGDEVVAGVINGQIGDGYLPEGTNGAIVSWSGTWPASEEIAVVLRGDGHAKLWLTATGGAGYGNGLGLMFPRARRSGTIAVPASHPELIAVGCTVNRRSWPMLEGAVLVLAELEPDDVCSFSAAGPNALGVMKPDLVAPGMNLVSAMSRSVDPRTSDAPIFASSVCPAETQYCYVVDETHAVSSGTSMSAPQVAGAMALLLQRDPSLTQRKLLQLLQASVAQPTGALPFQVAAGPGRLDLARTLDLLEGGTLGVEASAARSFWNLGGDYLRPRLDRTLDGVVELRDEEGRVVGSVPPGELEVRAVNARVVKPITRVAPGLWRFSVAGEAVPAGTLATVEVRHRGVSLGKRTLPVAADPWLADGRLVAAGGCAASPYAETTRLSFGSWGCVALGWLAARRRTVTSSRARPRSRR